MRAQDDVNALEQSVGDISSMRHSRDYGSIRKETRYMPTSVMVMHERGGVPSDSEEDSSANINRLAQSQVWRRGQGP